MTTTSNASTGTLITIVQDVPACNAISANVVVQGLSFTTTQGATYGYLTTTPSFAPEIKLNLEQLRDFSTILYEYPVRAGSYYQANLSFELAQLVAYDPTLSPPTHIFTVGLTPSRPIITLSSPLNIVASQANVILMDFDVRAMLGTNSTGDLTGRITPLASITQLHATNPTTGAINPNGFAEIDDLWGFVTSVSTTNKTSNPTFTGSFNMQILSPSTADAPNVPININANTNGVGFSDLGHLLPDSYVEADVFIDPQGNIVAKKVEMQEVEDPFPTQSGVTPSTALIGPIVSIQTDPAGNPKTLNLWVRDAEPDDTSTLTMDNIYQVDLTSNPTYQASVMGPNFANLSFGPQNMAVGQELVVHGTYKKPPAGTTNLPYTVEPTAIFLRLQSMQGKMNSMLQIGSDNATGVFTLAPCCTLLQGVPLYIVTNNQTAFVNVMGLSEITPVNNLVVKGMPYYESQATTINGVAIPAGTMVMQAKQVHVLQ